MGFDWSDQAEEAIQNQALMAEVSDLPSKVISNLCTQSCIDTVKRYRDHNQNMCDDLKRLEKDRRDYVLIVERFEEQIKGFQANELQHSYDTNYWKWEKNELETKLSKSKEEKYKLKEELAKVKLDIEKFSYASKIMDSLLKAQIHDEMKPGLGYNNTPPPYNNTYITPTSDLLETKEKEACENRNNAVSKEIPLENNIVTNEGGGRIWVNSKEIEKSKEKTNKMNFKRFVQKPVGYRKAGKKHVAKKSVETKGHMKKKVLKESIIMWVPRSTKTVSTTTSISTADRDSAARSNTAATSVSTADNFNASNTVSASSKVTTANTVTTTDTVATSNKVSTAKHASAANVVSSSKTSTISSKCAAKPIVEEKSQHLLGMPQASSALTFDSGVRNWPGLTVRPAGSTKVVQPLMSACRLVRGFALPWFKEIKLRLHQQQLLLV
ncbi:hypothetical protein L6452_40471 [Arctium lappa]|uniref:Uncharacterized protein n=1 Tax=Arctium lappa TaxID=4217 RepID=A0ACB8XR50_ARCLA|nr:hypothetical protein L6452_40471 [Arctium lappa]